MSAQRLNIHQLDEKIVQIIIDTIYPVGSLYLSVNNVNPSILFGGTWTVWGTGRIPVGVDTGQTEFNTVEKTGGAKTHTLSANEMPSHTHTQYPHGHSFYRSGNGGSNWTGIAGSPSNQYAATYYVDDSIATNQNTGGGAAHNNLQPYITCYMWKRTA